MRLYTNNKGEWTGTQADAKQAWGKDMALVEVPTSKDALMAWLNKCSVVSQMHQQAAAVATKVQVTRHPLSCSANDVSGYDVRDVVLNCPKEHLGQALASIISRLHDIEV